MNQDDPQSDGVPIIEITPIEPTKDEIEYGLARLQPCLEAWDGVPGLVVMKPAYAVLGQITQVKTDAAGFQVIFRIDQVLIAPANYDAESLVLQCFWNQPYLSFDQSEISAPYSFYLHLGRVGAERAAELWKALSRDGQPAEEWVSVLRDCFSDDEDQYRQLLKSILRASSE